MNVNFCNVRKNINKPKPELSSQQRLDKKVMGYQSSARDVEASRERSRENLTNRAKKRHFRLAKKK